MEGRRHGREEVRHLRLEAGQEPDWLLGDGGSSWGREEGVVRGVREDTPAAGAAVPPGARLQRVAGEEVRDNAGVAAALAGAGREVEVDMWVSLVEDPGQGSCV